MRAVKAVPSARTLTFGIDTILTLTRETAIQLFANRISFRIGYIDLLTPAELADTLAAGLQVGFVTYALEFDPAHTLARLKALGAPQGVTVWIDVEGSSLEGLDIIAKVNAWAAAVQNAGYEAGIYVGAGCPLSPAQLQALAVTRYWHSVSRVPEPSRGMCMEQITPDEVFVCGVKVDVNVVKPDYRGDLPTFAAA